MEIPVTKKEIVKKISDKVDLTQLKTKEIVDLTFQAIIETLETKGRIELRKFGVFEVRQRKARKARNPRSNEVVFVKAKNVVTFQPGKEMEEKVRLAKTVIVKRKIRKTKTTAKSAATPVLVPNGVPTEPVTLPMDRTPLMPNDSIPLKPR
jgi:integration host factor subunit beta